MSADVFFKLGVDHYKKGEYKKSLQDFSKAIELNPQNSEAYNNRGFLLQTHFKDYEKSLQDYSKTIELNPQYSGAYINRGILLVTHFKDYEKSLQDYSKAIELNPQDSDAYYNRGVLLQTHFKDYEKSLQDYSKAIELNPQNSGAYNNRGFLLENHFKEYEKSLQDFSKAIELNPQYSDAYFNRGILLQTHFKDYEKSLQDYSKTIELNPQYSDAYYNRGILLQTHFKEYEKSLQDYSKAIELNPQNSQAYNNRGDLLQTHFKDYEKSLQDYSKAIELNPQNSEAYYNRGNLLKTHFQDYEKSLQDYSKAIELNPQYSDAYNNRGILLETHFKDYEKSLQDYSKAIELNPQDSLAYNNRGSLLKNHFQEYEKAILNFSKVIELDPNLKGHRVFRTIPKRIQDCQRLLNEKEKERVNLLQDQLKDTTFTFDKSFPVLRDRVDGKLIQMIGIRGEEPNPFSLDSRTSRVSEKIVNVDERNYCTTHPTHSFAVNQKLDFDVSIGSSNHFASKFSSPLLTDSNFRTRKKIHFDDLSSEKHICSFFESVLVDFENDEELGVFVDGLRREYQTRLEEERKRLKSVEFLDDSDPILSLVNEILVGIALFFIPMKSDNTIDGELLKERYENLKKYLLSVRETRGNNSVYLGELKKRCGVCRHRSTLCKVVCDELGIRCRLICVAGYHAWNVIWIKDKFFVVDLMNYWHKGLIGLDEPLEYRKTKESPVEKMSFLELQKKSVEDMFENERKGREYESIMKSLESLIVEEEIRKQRELFFKARFEDPEGRAGENLRILGVEKGGFGRITNFVVEEAKELNDSENVAMLSKGQKISVKQIPILEEEENEGEEEEEEELNSVVNVTNLKEGMERKYALKEKSFMRILDHPNIIKSLGSFEFEDKNGRKHLCILMNSMEKDGGAFLSLLRRKSTNMSLERKLIEVLYFLIDASQGLQYMHRMNIIHLDFKLENIMVNWDPAKKEITDLRIIDFGGAKETDYRTSTVVFTTDKNDSPEVLIQKRRRNVKRTMGLLRNMIKKDGGGGYSIDDENNLEVNERIDEIMACLVEGIPGKYRETPKVLAHSLKDEIEFILRLEKDYEDFVEIDENRIRSLRETMKKVRKEERESLLLRLDDRADVFSFGKIIEMILKYVKVPSSSQSENLEGLKCIVKDLLRIKNSCLKEKKEERPTMEGIMIALLVRLSLTIFPPSFQ